MTEIINPLKNGWKQPIPTNLEVVFGEDYRAIQLYKELIYRACHKDQEIVYLGGNEKIVQVHRGQVIFGRIKFGKYLGWSAKTVERTLHKLSKNYQKVTISANHNYSIITIHDYDSITGMSNWRPSGDPVKATSKSDKNDDNVKTIDEADDKSSADTQNPVFLDKSSVQRKNNFPTPPRLEEIEQEINRIVSLGNHANFMVYVEGGKMYKGTSSSDPELVIDPEAYLDKVAENYIKEGGEFE
jgi:hypothetical protein